MKMFEPQEILNIIAKPMQHRINQPINGVDNGA